MNSKSVYRKEACGILPGIVPDRCCHEQYNEYSGMGGTCIGNSER